MLPGRVMRPVAIVGPTATGKSALAVALAEELNGEVINADAMQLYRGMDIGTAKITEAERGGVPHHLLDVLDVTETASVAAYQRQTRATIEELLAAGRRPVLVGGSGLYVQAVPDDPDFPGPRPARPPGVRARHGRRAHPLRAAQRPRPGRGAGHPAHQRPAHRAGARGDRADRPAVLRLAAHARAGPLRRGAHRARPRHRRAG